MTLKLIVAITDYDWFELLRASPEITEVNFWAPSARDFRALEPGELFLFKLHAPYNKIVGGGVFAYSTMLPWTLAWEAFGRANGANSAGEMRDRIARYRRADSGDRTNFEIGCRILTQPFFLEERDWIDPPASLSKHVVAFKTYTTSDEEGAALWEFAHDRLSGTTPFGVAETQARFGEPQLIRPRLGQGAFRVVVTDNYQRRCAITKERTLPALEAAHIRPYGDGGTHDVRNGLLLRRDIHSLFDAGYVTVTPDLSFEVSRRIREEFENGKHYYALHGQKIFAPDDRLKHPDVEALRWHNEERFRP